ncbi:MAG: hypothetical protein JW807_04355 [Spirochaetes bacterium]|nr:hypothetical protein [Spirochaetota bacterium]
MTPSTQLERKTKTRLVVAVIAFGVVLIALLFIFTGNRSAGVDESRNRGQAEEAQVAAEELDIKNMSREEIEEGQINANRAAISGKPVSGKVTERPDYVSRVEWEVFQNVVRNQPGDDDAQLTALVNKILFYKKKEAWETAGTGTDQRARLGRELRDMLPYMKEGGHIHPDEAKRLESALYNDLGR